MKLSQYDKWERLLKRWADPPELKAHRRAAWVAALQWASVQEPYVTSFGLVYISERAIREEIKAARGQPRGPHRGQGDHAQHLG